MRFSALPAFVFCACLAQQSLAETAMTAAEFDAYATGKTLTYSVDGQVYGAEQYLTGHQVLWAFKDGECAKGIWYEQAGLICFAYENNDVPQCWNFFLGANGLRAQFVGEGGGSDLSEVDQSPTPLSCAGPDVGV